ncbi:tripartite tricarboxylate transporter substrate binding protein [Arthrobacter sp. ISL-85]|nr:tripartite tricarboxylate transporter substrate-binding protein [Arthrobacter sp. ISL-85]MBT2564942.1 tripartite tricarboxylate transporter substrate binding protein [Arthrobacter sp. ISL-85]
MMALRSTVRVIALATVLALCACGTSTPEATLVNPTRMMVPNSPGGGYDITARIAARVMEDAGIAGHMEIFNVPGEGGSVAIARLMNETGNRSLVMMMGLGVVGSNYANGSRIKVSDATPVAKLLEEPEGILVPANSPYRTVGDLVAAWKADPGSITVGGGSAVGGPDHLFPMEMARATGIRITDVDYRSYSGGGELLPALLGNKITFGTSGIAEYEEQITSGQLRVLAVSGQERQHGVEAPTLRESGIDLAFTNWRGLMAPPGLTDADRNRLLGAVTRLHDSPGWRQALLDNGWKDSFSTGADFETFLRQQESRVANTLTELGIH